MIGSDTALEVEVVSTLTTPAGTPTSSSSFTKYSVVSGVSSAGLMTTVQPAASAGAILRVAIASGKFQGVMKKHGPTGRCVTIIRPVPSGFVPIASGDARRLLREPAQELAAVGHLAAGLRERLAHLERHQQRELVRPLHEQFPGRAQQLAARAGGRGGPRRGCRDRGVESRCAIRR